jgi:hypothetical protein
LAAIATAPSTVFPGLMAGLSLRRSHRYPIEGRRITGKKAGAQQKIHATLRRSQQDQHRQR